MTMLFSLLLFSVFSNKLVLKVFGFSCSGECFLNCLCAFFVLQMNRIIEL